MWTETSYVKIIHSSSLDMHVCTFTILCWLVCQWKNHIGSITVQELYLFFGIRWIVQQNLFCSWLSVFPHSLHFTLLCVKFIKCVNAWPEADFYGGNAESCDEKGNRCVMCIYVFCPHIYDISGVLLLLWFLPLTFLSLVTQISCFSFPKSVNTNNLSSEHVQARNIEKGVHSG